MSQPSLLDAYFDILRFTISQKKKKKVSGARTKTGRRIDYDSEGERKERRKRRGKESKSFTLSPTFCFRDEGKWETQPNHPFHLVFRPCDKNIGQSKGKIPVSRRLGRRHAAKPQFPTKLKDEPGVFSFHSSVSIGYKKKHGCYPHGTEKQVVWNLAPPMK